MIVRRMSSRRVGLTAAFLALAAGGAAACDAPEPDYSESEVPVYSDIQEVEDAGGEIEDGEEDSAEVFYCADADGMVVEEEFCDDAYPVGTYFLWHSTWYAPGMTPGEYLDDGDYFDARDRTSRKAFKLPSTGTVANGTIKTGVVGRSSGGSSSVGASSGG
jgi:hypothetical protein